jgi:hypothetical protein
MWQEFVRRGRPISRLTLELTAQHRIASAATVDADARSSWQQMRGDGRLPARLRCAQGILREHHGSDHGSQPERAFVIYYSREPS